MSTPTIAEVLAWCTWARDANHAMSRIVGNWVATTDDPDRQRLFAASSSRLAWHAELWERRLPVVPLEAADLGALLPTEPAATTEARLQYLLAWLEEGADGYAEWNGSLRDVDRLLDPATARVIALVSADLKELLARASP